jgi:hypothetical protein
MSGPSWPFLGRTLLVFSRIRVSFSYCSLSITYLRACVPLLPKGQMGEAWEPSKEQSSFGNRGTLYAETTFPSPPPHSLKNVLECLRQLVAGLSPQRPGFDPWSVSVRFVEGKSDTDTGFSPTASVYPCQCSSTNVSYVSCSA